MTDTLTLVDLNPADLILPIDGNVRKDTQLDKHFLASVKNRGVLQPVLVTPNGDGGYEVLDGQRRTLAAGHPTIPAVITTERAEQERIADQLIVNDQRTNLTDVEHAAAFKQLSLFGLSAMQISKKTSTPLARVGDAITVANNEQATAAMTELGLDLTRAVVIAEFADDKQAVKKLTDVAGSNPGGFDHVVKGLRDKRALADHIAQLRAEINADGYRALNDVPAYGKPSDAGDLIPIDELAKEDTPTVPLTIDDIHGLPGVAAAVKTGYQMIDGAYKDWASIAFYIEDPEGQGFVKREFGQNRTAMTPEQLEAEAERQRARDERDARAAARDQVAAVRWAFITEFLQRPTLPADSITYIAWATTYANATDITTKVLELLDIPAPEQTVHGYYELSDADRAVQAHLAARPTRALHFLLAAAIDSVESIARYFDPEDNRREHEQHAVRFHLEQLRAWGYGLSDLEKTLLDTAPADEQITAPDTDEDEA